MLYGALASLTMPLSSKPMSDPANCPYCRTDQDYDLYCTACRVRFRTDHLHGKWTTAKRLLYNLRPGTPILEVREEQEE